MVEAFDAAGVTTYSGARALLLALIWAAGLATEIGLALARRRAAARELFVRELVFSAFSGQPTFWSVALSSFFLIERITVNTRAIELTRSWAGFAMAIAVVVLIVRVGTNWVRLYFRQQQIGSVTLINNTVRFLGVMVVVATLMALLGVPVAPLLTVVAGSSVGLTLALREPLANLFSGMVVIASGKVRPGDYVRLSSGEEGYVTDIRWSDTSIRQLTNNLIVVPNSLMTGTIFVNYNRPDSELAVLFDMGVTYDADLGRVEALVMEVGREVMEEVEGGVPEFEPFIRYNAFADAGVRFTTILRAKTFVDQYLVKHEFVKRLQARFHAEGIAFAFPIRVVQLRPDEGQRAE